jgi:DNA-binding winged helix-turn-helix (wHTH) protein
MKSSSVWRFGPFELDPVNRRLTQDGHAVALQPKAFDVLTVLVSKAGALVARKELFDAVWPKTEVEDANLTNNIAILRKVLGPGAIKVIPKYGYSFNSPVDFAPILPEAALRALRQGQTQMSLRLAESVRAARDSFLLAIAHQPEHAPSWAWLGRACRFLEKFGIDRCYHRQVAEAAFKRAFALDADLACAHQFFTALEVDRGEALSALLRLLNRVKQHPDDPYSFAALVQVCRFCGLLDASEAAHRLVLKLDPTVPTSVPHTYFARCDYYAVVEAYAEAAQQGRNYLDVSAWACLGFKERAELEISKRLEAGACAPVFEALLTSLLFALRRNSSEVKKICLAQDLYEDPESSLYFARHLAFCGCVDAAFQFLRQAVDGGLAIPDMLRHDAWLSSLRSCAEFELLLAKTRAIQTRARRCLSQLDTCRILGPMPARRKGTFA